MHAVQSTSSLRAALFLSCLLLLPLAVHTGCEQVDEPPAGADAAPDAAEPVTDTWENWAHPIFLTTYCTRCHPGQSNRDFGDYEVVAANTEHMRCGVSPVALDGCPASIPPGHLPIGDGPFPTDAERNRLVKWIDDGLLRQMP